MNLNDLLVAWNLSEVRHIGWAAAQVSVVAAAAFLLVSLARSINPRLRVHISLLGLILMALVPIVVLSRSDGWSLGAWIPKVDKSQNTNDVEFASAGDDSQPNPNSTAVLTTDYTNENRPLTFWQNLLVGTSTVFIEKQSEAKEQANAATAKSSRGLSASTIVLSLLGICISCGVVRLVAGFWLIKRLREGAVPVEDLLVSEVESCAHRVGVTQAISIAETGDMGSAAVVGWRKPTLLLPSSWRTWTVEERKAVVAHELAHVKRNDFLAAAIGQLAVALNFYHPLAHLVLRRLRLDQELAADALAAEAVGGQRQYVEILAGLALRQPKVRTPGPAQAFLPPRRMFVRRLEMLRNSSREVSWLNRAYAVTATLALFAIAALATGLRPYRAVAQNPGAAAVATTTFNGKPLTSYLQKGLFEAVALIDMPAVLRSPAIVTLQKRSQLPEEISLPGNKLPISDVDQILVALLTGISPESEPDFLIIVRAKNALKEVESDSNSGIRLLDSHTLAAFADVSVMNMLDLGGADEKWARLLDKNADSGVRIAGNLSWVGKILAGAPSGGPTLLLAPLWEDVETMAAGVAMDKDMEIAVQLETDEPQKVSDTLTAIKLLASNYLDGISKTMMNELGNESPSQAAAASIALDVGEKLLGSVEIDANAGQVNLTATVSDAAYPLVAMALPAVASARSAARRTQSMNNVKQLMLAFHNYHEVYRHLPAAVVVDEQSGQKRSWRVELLPFLEEEELYKEYRKDEPWDSEANMRVLEKMPLVFAVPGAKDATSTPYQTLIGDGGALMPTKAGGLPGWKDFTDGLSNTVMLVETKRLVPWTKPVDIDDTRAVPLIGTSRESEPGIVAGLADGSVRFIAESIDTEIWRGLTTRDGGEVIKLP
ncbi:MAG: M56 family metallopeptidase [Planctomycetota bacterium]